MTSLDQTPIRFGHQTRAMELASEAPADPAARLTAIKAEMQRRRWAADPQLWARERLGIHLWSGQVRIANSVRDNRKTAVPSCHEAGKSFSAAVIAAWWLDIHKAGEAFVVTSAPTAPQVRAILWREIGRVHARGNLKGRVNQTEWLMEVTQANGEVKEELVAFGRKPDDYSPTAFQGIHARFVLVLLDEACGIEGLWDAAESLIANDNSKMLAIGNPDDPATTFAKICAPGSGWNVETLSAFDTPAFSGEQLPAAIKDVLIGRTYVEERRAKWAPSWYWVDANGQPSTPDMGVRVVPPEGTDPKKIGDSAQPFWFSKVLGQFPELSGSNNLIPISWVKAAQQRRLDPLACQACGLRADAEVHGEAFKDGHKFVALPNEMGLDVGGGGDSSCGCHRIGGIFRIKWEDRNPDTMQTCGKAISVSEALGCTLVKVDEIGIGRGVKDRAIELRKPFVGINVGAQDVWDHEHFVNLRAEYWWQVRELFEKGLIDIDENDADLASELVDIRFKRVSGGKIQIESKDEAKRRGVRSPNRADALMLASARPRRGQGDYGVTI